MTISKIHPSVYSNHNPPTTSLTRHPNTPPPRQPKRRRRGLRVRNSPKRGRPNRNDHRPLKTSHPAPPTAHAGFRFPLPHYRWSGRERNRTFPPLPNHFRILRSQFNGGRNSSTTTSSHVPLRGGGSSSTNILNGSSSGGKRMTMTIFPPNSPPRNPRRLRMKSRPPHLYDNIFEMVEDLGSGTERRASGVSSFEVDERDSSPINHDVISSPSPPSAIAATTSPNQHPSQPTPPNPTISTSSPPSAFPPSSSPPPSTPNPTSPSNPQPQLQHTKPHTLLSRIGSVKKWSAGVTARRKRTSTNEGVDSHPHNTHHTHTHNRTGSEDSGVSRDREREGGEGEKNGTGWFFRVTGGEPGPPPLLPSSSVGGSSPLRGAGVGEDTRSQSHMKLTKKKSSRVFERLPSHPEPQPTAHAHPRAKKPHPKRKCSTPNRPSSP